MSLTRRSHPGHQFLPFSAFLRRVGFCKSDEILVTRICGPRILPFRYLRHAPVAADEIGFEIHDTVL